MSTQTVSKEDLLDAMRASAEEFVASARGVARDRWSEGRYEEGWTAKDILAHVASIEWTYAKVLDLARAPEAARAERTEKPADAGASGISGGGVGTYNDRQVAKRADSSVEELIAEFERNRAATIAAVEDADEELLSTPVRTTGGIEGPAGQTLYYLTVVHVGQHLEDIRRA